LGNNQERAEVVRLTSLTYGGQALTFVNRAQVESSAVSEAVEIWVLNEAGIAAATDSTLVPTWDIPADDPGYSHAFFSGINQASVVGATAIATTPAATPNPITTAPLATMVEDVVITGAINGQTGTYTPQNSFTLGTTESLGSSTIGSAYKLGSGSSETPSMSHSAPIRQAIAGVVLQGVPIGPTTTSSRPTTRTGRASSPTRIRGTGNHRGAGHPEDSGAPSIGLGEIPC